MLPSLQGAQRWAAHVWPDNEVPVLLRCTARRRALEALQWTAGQPCSLCNGDTGTDRRNLPAEVADHCADVGLDVGPLCASCW
jgi:hypothetical protein